MQNVPFECCDGEKRLHDAIPEASAPSVQQTSVVFEKHKENEPCKDKNEEFLYSKCEFAPGLKSAGNRASGLELFTEPAKL